MKRFEFMIRGAVTALAAFGALAMCPVAQAQSVTVNSSRVCTSAPTLSMTPAGDLQIVCTPVSTGGGATAPTSCTVASPTVSTDPTAMVTVGASCLGGAPTTFSWTSTMPGFQPVNAGSVSVGPFPSVAGPYTFSVVASNIVGAAPIASGTLTIIPASTGGGGGGGTAGCPTSPTNGVFTGTVGGNSATAIQAGGFASFALPEFTAANNSYQLFGAVESNNTASGLQIEYTVSPCVGDFTSMPTVCTKFGGSNSAISLYAFEGATAQTAGAAVCVMQPNTQYFLNVRTVKVDGTNSCTTGTCSLYVQYHLFTY